MLKNKIFDLIRHFMQSWPYRPILTNVDVSKNGCRTILSLIETRSRSAPVSISIGHPTSHRIPSF